MATWAASPQARRWECASCPKEAITSSEGLCQKVKIWLKATCLGACLHRSYGALFYWVFLFVLDGCFQGFLPTCPVGGVAERCRSSLCPAEGERRPRSAWPPSQASSSPQVFTPLGFIRLKPGMWLRWAWNFKKKQQTGWHKWVCQFLRVGVSKGCSFSVRPRFVRRPVILPSGITMSYRENVKLVNSGTNLFINTKVSWNDSRQGFEHRADHGPGFPTRERFSIYLFFPVTFPKWSVLCRKQFKQVLACKPGTDYLACGFLYEGAVHPRNMAQGFQYQDDSSPAEHLGALLEISPSTFLLQSGGAQSVRVFRLLALERQAWKTLDGSQVQMPWSLKPFWSQQFSERKKKKKKGILVFHKFRKLELFCSEKI